MVVAGLAPAMFRQPIRLPVAFASKVLRRLNEGCRWEHPAPRQGALQAPWLPVPQTGSPTLNSYQ